MEAQWEDTPGTATLYLLAKQSYCLHFWYYMYGELTPSLIATTQTRGSVNEPIFIRNGSQGDLWHPATVPLDIHGASYNVSVGKNLTSSRISMSAMIYFDLFHIFLSAINFKIRK